MKQEIYTLEDFKADFPNDDACLAHIWEGRKISACKCGKGKFYRVKNRKCYACSFCARQVYPLAGTIYERTSTPLVLWFYAIFLLSHDKNIPSAKELERQLGVTYKTAWRMKKQILKTVKKKTSVDAIKL